MTETSRIFSRPRRWLSARRWRATLGWIAEVLRAMWRRRREARDSGRLAVAVDIASLYEPLAGIGWYVYQLLRHAAPRGDLRLRLYGPALIDDPHAPRPVVELPVGPAVDPVLYPHPPPLALGAARLARWLHRLSPLLVAADGNRVLFAPNYLAPPHFRLAHGALVATVHDLAIEKVPWAVRPDSRAALAELLTGTFLAAARLITPSEAVRGEIIAAGHFDGARVHAIHHGPGQSAGLQGAAAQSSPRLSAPGRSASAFLGRYGLFVGTLEPRKNVGGLIDAWRRLRRRQPVALVLCGQYGWNAGEIRRRVAAASEEGWLEHLGYLPVEELVALVRGAAVVALPSLYEGFGLPALEALELGAPLVASDLPVLREVAGDAALYAPPDDPEAWAGELERVLSDPDLAAELREKGRLRSARFSWQKAVDETVEVLRLAAG